MGDAIDCTYAAVVAASAQGVSAMEFSLLNAVRNHPAAPRPLAEVYSEYVSDCVLVQDPRFNRAWFG